MESLWQKKLSNSFSKAVSFYWPLCLLTCILFLTATTARSQNFEFEKHQKIVAIGDLHADTASALEALIASRVLDKNGRFIAHKNNISDIVFVGDMANKGPSTIEVWDLILYLDAMAKSHSIRLHVHAGNHDQAILEGYFVRMTKGDLRQFEKFHPNANRGIWKAISRAPYLDLMKKLKVMTRIGKYIFVHGSFVFDNYQSYSIKTLNLEFKDLVLKQLAHVRARLNGLSSEPPRKSKTFHSWDYKTPQTKGVDYADGPLWNRNIFVGEVSVEAIDRALEHWGAKTALVGHTPSVDGKIHSHFNGRVIQIDTNISRGMTAKDKVGSPSALVIHPNGETEAINNLKRGKNRAALFKLRNSIKAQKCLSIAI